MHSLAMLHHLPEEGMLRDAGELIDEEKTDEHVEWADRAAKLLDDDE
jgi:hypothetical protein